MATVTSFEAIELERLRAHFELVSVVLQAQPTSRLRAHERVARANTIARLERYATDGRFPRNDSPWGWLPAFVDARGTPCAVAHLMIESGENDLVERVRGRMNHAYIREIAAAVGDDLGAWAARAGLTLAEASLIQPEYCGKPSGPEDGCYTIVPVSKPKDEPCEYVVVNEPNWTECLTDSGSEGHCLGGTCFAELDAEENAGCSVSTAGFGAGSMAPLIAALMILSSRRRARQQVSPTSRS